MLCSGCGARQVRLLALVKHHLHYRRQVLSWECFIEDDGHLAGRGTASWTPRRNEDVIHFESLPRKEGGRDEVRRECASPGAHGTIDVPLNTRGVAGRTM